MRWERAANTTEIETPKNVIIGAKTKAMLGWFKLRSRSTRLPKKKKPESAAASTAMLRR